MAPKFNYIVAPHLEEFNIPFSTFQASRLEFAHFVSGAFIFSRTASKTPTQETTQEGDQRQPLRMLLLQRSLQDSYGGCWEGPGGSCEPDDETLLEGVAREVFEESGFHVSRFVEFVSMAKWVKVHPDRTSVVAKFTFIVEVHEASAGYPHPLVGQEGREERETNGLSADDDAEDGRVASSVPVRWEDAVKLDPAEHQAYKWVTEDEIRQGELPLLGEQGKVMLEAFRMLRSLPP